MGIGVCDTPDEIVPLTAFLKELRIQWAVGYDKEDFQFAIDMMVSGRVDATSMITDVVGLDEVPDAFEALRTPSDQCKVLIDLTRLARFGVCPGAIKKIRHSLMEQLEFALVPIGLVLGYGVTKVLGAWAHVIHLWSGFKRPPVLFLSCTALSLFFMYWNFSGLWTYRDVNFELMRGSFNVMYLFAITLPMLLFMLAVSVIVPPNISQIINLGEHYQRSARTFHLIFAAAVGASLLPDMLPGVGFAPTPVPFLVIMLMFLVMGLVRSRTLDFTLQAFVWILVFTLNLIVFTGNV